MFDRLMKEEEKHPEKVFKSLKQSAHHKNFFKFINDRITKHFQKYEKAKVAYVLLKGFGKIYPYLRASKFISNFEAHLSSPEFGYKLIIFYPGRTSGNNYQMFNLLNDENLYRAHNLKS
ncbi:MAG: BREX protein BrxB domain-containing protein [Bacteroidota bacterium]